MPAYILLLIAVVPVLAMVATAGNALGRDAQLAAVIALTITLFGVITWLVVGTVRTVLEIWRRVKPNPTGSARVYRAAERPRYRPRHIYSADSVAVSAVTVTASDTVHRMPSPALIWIRTSMVV
jgi:hypothetical protein